MNAFAPGLSSIISAGWMYASLETRYDDREVGRQSETNYCFLAKSAQNSSSESRPEASSAFQTSRAYDYDFCGVQRSSIMAPIDFFQETQCRQSTSVYVSLQGYTFGKLYCGACT